MNDAEQQHWSVDKRVNISHILTTGSMLIALFVFINKVDQRITILEANSQHNSTTVNALDNRLNRIEDKLDRLIEKAK